MEDSLKDKFPHLPERLAGLGELASNLWWSWHPEARNLFTMLDLLAWRETGHNPVKLLEALPAQTLEAAAVNPQYLRHYDPVLAQFRRDFAPSPAATASLAIGSEIAEMAAKVAG